jgi:hypothetical protein
MRDCPGIQAADILAWYIGRNYARQDYVIDAALLTARVPHRHEFFDASKLIACRASMDG